MYHACSTPAVQNNFGGNNAAMDTNHCADGLEQRILEHQLFSTLVNYNDDWQIAEALIEGLAEHADVEPEYVRMVLRDFLAEKESLAAAELHGADMERHSTTHSSMGTFFRS